MWKNVYKCPIQSIVIIIITMIIEKNHNSYVEAVECEDYVYW